MKTAQEIFEEQKQRDRKHHEERLEWLSEVMPTYADGAPVAALDVINWKEESRLCLADPTGMRGLNSAHQLP